MQTKVCCTIIPTISKCRKAKVCRYLAESREGENRQERAAVPLSGREASAAGEEPEGLWPLSHCQEAFACGRGNLGGNADSIRPMEESDRVFYLPEMKTAREGQGLPK